MDLMTKNAQSPPPSISLHIDELVLHGLAAGKSHRIGEALEHELTRLLSEQGLPPAFSQEEPTAHLDRGAFEIGPDSTPETIAAQLANAIHGGSGQ